MTIKVTLNPGHSMNYHSHQHRDEVWVVISGTGRTVVDGMTQQVHARRCHHHAGGLPPHCLCGQRAPAD